MYDDVQGYEDVYNGVSNDVDAVSNNDYVADANVYEHGVDDVDYGDVHDEVDDGDGVYDGDDTST